MQTEPSEGRLRLLNEILRIQLFGGKSWAMLSAAVLTIAVNRVIHSSLGDGQFAVPQPNFILKEKLLLLLI